MPRRPSSAGVCAITSRDAGTAPGAALPRALSYRVPPWFPRAVPFLLGLVLAVEVLVIAPLPSALSLAASAAWMALPGVLFAWRALGSTDTARATAWLVGPALGFGLSVFGLLLWWAAGVQGWLAVLCAPLLTWVLAVIARRGGGATLRLPTIDRRDRTAARVALLVVPIITFAPYNRVAEPTPDGDAYRAYFTADFVWAMTVTAELAKGDVPPANPFLATQPMRYYWMSHLLSGAVYRNLRSQGVSAEQVVLVNGLAFGLAFIAFMYWLARAAGAAPALAALAVAVGFLANSYEALDRLWLVAQGVMPLDAVRTLNIDAVTRWFYQGMPVDGLQRLLLYQPHHLTGYVLALSALWLVGLAEDVTAIAIALWAGILLGLAFLFSTFTAIILGGAIAILYLVRLVQQGRLRSILQCGILGAAPVILAIGVSASLGYTDPREGFLIQFGINRVALRHWPYVLLLSFGPLLLAGVGLLRGRWALGPGAPAAALVVAALGFYFTADVPDMGGVWVGWRSGHLLLIAFAIIGAAAVSAGWRQPSRRLALAAVMVPAILLGIPTVAIDVFNAQDITNREQGPGFPWTLIITPPEREALDWVRANTPADALVQVEPYIRDAGTWAYVPAFAERRMAAGLPISMIPLRPYQETSEHVRLGIFQAADAAEAHRTAQFLGIDYLLVGRPERTAYRPATTRMSERPDLFAQVFRNDAIAIYQVAGTASRP